VSAIRSSLQKLHPVSPIVLLAMTSERHHTEHKLRIDIPLLAALLQQNRSKFRRWLITLPPQQ
jgi:hypothetical protein